MERQHIVIEGSGVFLLEGIAFSSFTNEQRARIGKFIEVVGSDARGTYVRGSKRLFVGRIALGQYDIVAPPPFEPEVLVSLILYTAGFDLSRYVKEEVSGVTTDGRRGDHFLRLLAALMISLSEGLVRGHIAKGYVRGNVLVTGLRGNIKWSQNFGKHPSDGWYCEVFEQTTNELLNGLILAGLTASQSILTGTSRATAAATQVFIWRQITEAAIPASSSFELASRRLSRLTEPYRPILALSKALTLGLSPRELNSSGDTGLNHLEFSVPLLYELFLVKILKACVRDLGLTIDFKGSDRVALVDADGDTYREIEPDIVVLRQGIPVGVIDAKFKPRYVDSRLAPSIYKVTSADIYQLFFYQSRLQSRAQTSFLPRAVILAPSFANQPLQAVEKRKVIWSDSASSNQERPALLVLAVEMDRALEMLRSSGEVEVARACMPEVFDELQAMVAHGNRD